MPSHREICAIAHGKKKVTTGGGAHFNKLLCCVLFYTCLYSKRGFISFFFTVLLIFSASEGGYIQYWYTLQRSRFPAPRAVYQRCFYKLN